MDFPEGLIKKDMKFPGVTEKISHVEFPEVLVLGLKLNIPRARGVANTILKGF